MNAKRTTTAAAPVKNDGTLATAQADRLLQKMKTAVSATIAPEQGDRLLTFREVHALLGSTCKTGHYARALAKRGKIRAVYLNERVMRYSAASVQKLIGGNGS
jgi:hypothetical protein